mmetsp:Transcript_28763/g.61031  ORF Transcript_28763/g.61031 Transcript_28763/m.61031 type:complete len:362 (-) Transcript_28763:1363-2448(-)
MSSSSDTSSSLSLMSANSSPFALARLSLAARRGSRRACFCRSTSFCILANSAAVKMRVEDTSCCSLARSSLESSDRSRFLPSVSSPFDFASASLSPSSKTKSGAASSLSASSPSSVAISSSSSSPESTSTHPSFSSASPPSSPSLTLPSPSSAASCFLEASYAARRSAPSTPLAALTSPYRNGLSPALCSPAPTRPRSLPLRREGFASRTKFTKPLPAMETLRSLCLAYPAMSRTKASTSHAVLLSFPSPSLPSTSPSSSASTDGTRAQIALDALIPTAICSPEHRSVMKLCAIVFKMPCTSSGGTKAWHACTAYARMAVTSRWCPPMYRWRRAYKGSRVSSWFPTTRVMKLSVSIFTSNL